MTEIKRVLNKQDIEELMEYARLHPEVMRGVVGRAEGDMETGEVVAGLQPWQRSLLVGKSDRLREPTVTVPRPAHMQPLPDPIKRDNLARVASLTKRLVDHYRKHRSLPIDLPEMREIMREAALAGRADIGAEDIKRLVIGVLEQADRDNAGSARERKVQELDRKLREGGVPPAGVLFSGGNRAERRKLQKATKQVVLKV